MGPQPVWQTRRERACVCHYEEETPLSTSHRNMRLRCSFSIRLSPCYAHAVAQPNAKKICLEASLAKKKQKLLRSNQAKRKKLGDLYFIGFYLMKKYLYFIIIATILIKLLASKLLCLLFYAISDLVSQVEGNHP
jgi:hypothetical protein